MSDMQSRSLADGPNFASCGLVVGKSTTTRVSCEGDGRVCIA